MYVSKGFQSCKRLRFKYKGRHLFDTVAVNGPENGHDASLFAGSRGAIDEQMRKVSRGGLTAFPLSVRGRPLCRRLVTLSQKDSPVAQGSERLADDSPSPEEPAAGTCPRTTTFLPGAIQLLERMEKMEFNS